MKSSTSTGASTTAPPEKPTGEEAGSPVVSRFERIDAALQARRAMMNAEHTGALRLFNGFYEGWPELVAEVYARTLLLYDYGQHPQAGVGILREVQAFYLEQLPWLQAVVVKARRANSIQARRGLLTYGTQPDTQLHEGGVRYALDLQMNQDASFYLDTRNLRLWALENLAGKSVIDCFAYTGSLGVAAKAAGASRVVFLDKNARFLQIARESYRLNGFTSDAGEFLVSDFFPAASRLRRSAERFDCAILDPPFFSSTGKGTVDLLKQGKNVINKIRPLVKHGGWLVVINNALFLEGAAYLRSLQELAEDGYLAIEALIPVPEDVTGFPHTIVRQPPADPAPFNHPTKIAVLRVSLPPAHAASSDT